MKTLNIRLLVAYGLAVFFGFSAFETYSSCLKTYNFGFAYASFGLLMILTLNSMYSPFEKMVLKLVRIPLNTVDTEGSIRDALKKQKSTLILISLLRVVGFFIMLPLLKDSEKSLFFVLLIVVSGLVRVPIAMWLFGDKIQKPFEYFVGLGLAAIATVIFQYKPNNGLSTSFDMLLFFVGLVKMILEVVISVLLRKITSPEFAKERCVSVKATQKIFGYFDVVFGVIGGLIVAQMSTQYNSSLPNAHEFMGILWIGIVVTLFSTVAGRLLNELSHATAQPISTLRPLLGLMFLFTSSKNIELAKMLPPIAAVILVVVGANISFWLGKPFK